MRYKALDSLRGIAAFVVVFAHCYQAIPETIRSAKPDLDFVLWSFGELGRFSVLMFFVLSGFVLSLPYLKGSSHNYRAYLVRRIWRLYPPYAVAVLVSALFCGLFADPSFWVGEWQHAPSGTLIASHLLMTGVGIDSTRLDGPIWSLIVEFRVSLVFPLLVMAVSRFDWKAVGCGVLFALGCYELNAARGASGETLSHVGQDALGTLLVTGRYVMLFLFGIFTAARSEQIKATLVKIPNSAHVLICAGAVAAHLVIVHWNHEKSIIPDIVYGCMSAYLIASGLAFAPLAKVLSARLVVWLGDISYSLYLIHIPVLWGVLYGIHGRVPLRTSIAIAVPVIFICAHLMNRVVERPSTELGRKIARRISERAPRPAVSAERQS